MTYSNNLIFNEIFFSFIFASQSSQPQPLRPILCQPNTEHSTLKRIHSTFHSETSSKLSIVRPRELPDHILPCGCWCWCGCWSCGSYCHEQCWSHGWRRKGGHSVVLCSDVILTSADCPPANGEEGELSQYHNFLSTLNISKPKR